ncbi:MAG: hypothetical protein OEP52_01290 [Acidimicrobiia bacterium]|nr:hypothetical protein [Acidimicrobiia bacterium]
MLGGIEARDVTQLGGELHAYDVSADRVVLYLTDNFSGGAHK